MIHVLRPKYSKETMTTCQKILLNPVHRDKLFSSIRFNMTKEEISSCRVNKYNGDVHVISCELDEYIPQNQRAIEKLMNADVVGFDTETRVLFSQPEILLPIALVQISTEDTVVLWRLRRERQFLRKTFPGILKSILQNKDIKKVI